jgi:hypothetical protein
LNIAAMIGEAFDLSFMRALRLTCHTATPNAAKAVSTDTTPATWFIGLTNPTESCGWIYSNVWAQAPSWIGDPNDRVAFTDVVDLLGASVGRRQSSILTG